jgi:hypothetical protein
MIVVHGVDRFGKLDEVDGAYLVTRFLHVCMMPIVPVDTEWVTRDVVTPVGVLCRLSWRSVFHAYVRTWGLAGAVVAAAFAMAGSLIALVPMTSLGILAAASFMRRRLRDSRALRRVALQRHVLGMSLDPALLPSEMAAELLPAAYEAFHHVSGGRTPLDVARDGATSPAQAAHAFVVLRLVAASRGRDTRRAAYAASERLVDATPMNAASGGPYRAVASVVAAAAPPVTIAAVPLEPRRRHFVVATLVAYLLCALIVAPSACPGHNCGGMEDIAITGVKKLAFESYPQWATRPKNAGQCPTVEQLAEYGGSVKDPWGQPYRVRCADLPPGAVGIAVWSNGVDRREGTPDDIRSWDP